MFNTQSNTSNFYKNVKDISFLINDVNFNSVKKCFGGYNSLTIMLFIYNKFAEFSKFNLVCYIPKTNWQKSKK